MEQKRRQETKKQENPFEILSQEDLKFIRGGEEDPPPPPPPPVPNEDDK